MANQVVIDLQDPQVRRALRQVVAEVVEDFVRANEMRAKELSLLERIVRVEEELKALREMAQARFEAIDKRFEAMDKRVEAMEKRFEALQREMDTGFEALQREMDTRFEVLEKRLNFMQWFMGAGFTVITILVTLFRFLH